ncbi:MAG: tRNA adenosine(34) deaminase TadA [bacterium]|nr:tRNA adenosine(34) deaminase TadA [bacterium]
MSNSEKPIWQVHQQYMAKALQLAERAFEEGEIPVGAIVVHENQIVGKGYNQVERLNDPTAHAEMLAISAACDTIDSKYLSDCTLYVTLEPCPMCAGGIIWSKLDTVVFGASDVKSGACGSLFNIADNEALNHRAKVIQGVLEHDAEYLLKAFFASKRQKF